MKKLKPETTEYIKQFFVTHEVAKKAKKAGFNEPCLSAYDGEGKFYDPFDYNEEDINTPYCQNSKLNDPFFFNASTNPKLLEQYLNADFVAAPLHSQLAMWLWKEKNIMVVQGMAVTDYNVALGRALDTLELNDKYQEILKDEKR